MAKIFKKLFIGDTVKIIGNKVFKKLTTEKPQDDSIVGTWVFNDVLQPYPVAENVTFNVDFSAIKNNGEEQQYNVFDVSYAVQYGYGDTWSFYYRLYDRNTLSANVQAYTTTTNTWGINKSITFNSDIDDVTFKTWLKANATKL